MKYEITSTLEYETNGLMFDLRKDSFIGCINKFFAKVKHFADFCLVFSLVLLILNNSKLLTEKINQNYWKHLYMYSGLFFIEIEFV